MILLRHDCLVFELADGELLPCSAEEMALSLLVDPPGSAEAETVRNAAAAVLHYFRIELGRNSISVAEFIAALTRILKGFGLDVDIQATATPAAPSLAPPPPVEVPVRPPSEVDLISVERDSGGIGELHFFSHLRSDLARRLESSPSMITYSHLRECTMSLASARRWTTQCQLLSDQIVDYLRACMKSQSKVHGCLLCIR